MSSRFETQDKLIAATRQIIIGQGIEGCSVEGICAKAGFTRGAFYSNFATKDALIEALAEEEYTDLIQGLRDRINMWKSSSVRVPAAGNRAEGSANVQQQSHSVMEDLLFDALNVIGINSSLYVLHNELMTRSVRDPQWGARLLELNNRFIEALSEVIETILSESGRRPTHPVRPLTHAVVGIALRAAGIDAWRTSVRTLVEGAHGITGTEHESIADSPARDIVELILLLMYAASEPVDSFSEL